MKTQLKFFLSFIVLFMLLACGGPSEEDINATSTSVAASIFATQTANAPTATPVPTNTPIPEPTATTPPKPTKESQPDDTNEQGNLYFPILQDFTYWYYNLDDSGNPDFTNFSLFEIAETDNGTPYYTFLSQNVDLSVDIHGFFADDIGLTYFYYGTYYPDDTLIDYAMAPGLDIFLLPLQDGDIWETETSYGDDDIVVGFEATYYPTLEFDSNAFDECFGITYYDGGLDGEAYLVEYYCLDFGRIGYEVLVDGEWLLYQLLTVTTGRVEWDDYINESDGSCTITLTLYGFEPGEQFDLTYYLAPDFSEPLNTWTDFDADLSVDFTFDSDSESGVYILDFNGAEGNTASFGFEWTGSCPER